MLENIITQKELDAFAQENDRNLNLIYSSLLARIEALEKHLGIKLKDESVGTPGDSAKKQS